MKFVRYAIITGAIALMAMMGAGAPAHAKPAAPATASSGVGIQHYQQYHCDPGRACLKRSDTGGYLNFEGCGWHGVHWAFDWASTDGNSMLVQTNYGDIHVSAGTRYHGEYAFGGYVYVNSVFINC